MTKALNFRRILIWLGLITLFGGLVWATDALLNRTNDNAAKVAAEGAQLEMTNIESTSVKPKKSDNIAWNQIKQYERQLKQNTASYETLIAKANSEKNANNGNVTEATRQAGRILRG